MHTSISMKYPICDHKTAFRKSLFLVAAHYFEIIDIFLLLLQIYV